MQNTTGNLMERTVARKLAQDLERRNILPPNKRGRGGGGGGESWKNNLEKRSQIRIRCLRRNREEGQTLSVAVDLEDAYNRVQFKLLMELHCNMESA